VISRCGGRTWWAHLTITRMNIARIILRNQIEEGMGVSHSSGGSEETALRPQRTFVFERF